MSFTRVLSERKRIIVYDGRRQWCSLYKRSAHLSTYLFYTRIFLVFLQFPRHHHHRVPLPRVTSACARFFFSIRLNNTRETTNLVNYRYTYVGVRMEHFSRLLIKRVVSLCENDKEKKIKNRFLLQ